MQFNKFCHRCLKNGIFHQRCLGQLLTMVKTLLMPLNSLAWNIFLAWPIPSSWPLRKSILFQRCTQQLLGAKKLVEHFNKSTKETYCLREKQKMLQLKEHKLIQDCPTRWGSCQCCSVFLSSKLP